MLSVCPVHESQQPAGKRPGPGSPNPLFSGGLTCSRHSPTTKLGRIHPANAWIRSVIAPSWREDLSYWHRHQTNGRGIAVSPRDFGTAIMSDGQEEGEKTTIIYAPGPGDGVLLHCKYAWLVIGRFWAAKSPNHKVRVSGPDAALHARSNRLHARWLHLLSPRFSGQPAQPPVYIHTYNGHPASHRGACASCQVSDRSEVTAHKMGGRSRSLQLEHVCVCMCVFSLAGDTAPSCALRLLT